MKNKSVLSAVLWTARIIGTLIVVLTLFIGIGELLEGQNTPGTGLDNYTIVTFVAWGIGLAGLLYAMRKPGTGGLISLLSFIVFNILVAANPNPDSAYTAVLLIFLLPSILFLSVWWLKKQHVE